MMKYGGISRTKGKKCELVRTAQKHFFAEIGAALDSYRAKFCQNLIINGVVFGNYHLKKKHDAKEKKKYLDKVFRLIWGEQHRSREMIFTFVLTEELLKFFNGNKDYLNLDEDYLRDLTSSVKGKHIFIPIDITRLTHKSMRRNTKLFKINGPSLLFPSVKRITWNDTKLDGSSLFHL